MFWWSLQLKFLTTMSSLFLTSTQRTVSTASLLIYVLSMNISELETREGERGDKNKKIKKRK